MLRTIHKMNISNLHQTDLHKMKILDLHQTDQTDATNKMQKKIKNDDEYMSMNLKYNSMLQKM